MAQSQTDSFDFLITPKFDVSSIDDASKTLQTKIENISKELANELSKSFTLPAGLQPGNFQEVIKYVESLGGSVKRNGTTISASFKDIDGNIVSFKKNISDAVDVVEKFWAGNKKNKELIQNLKDTGTTYTGSSQISQQNELEQQIIKSIQEQYNLEKKIQEAKASNNTINETYYTGLQNIAKQEESNYRTNYNGSQTRINSIKNELEAEQKLYNTKLQSTQAQQNITNTLKDYVKQYQSLQSLESKGKQDTQAYKDTQAAMQSLIQTLKQYGIEIQTDNNGTQQFVVAQKNAENQTDKVAEALRGANVYLATHTENQNKLITSIQQSVENFVKYQVAMEAINKLTSEFTSAIYDMNEAMTQVRMVTMGSYEDTVQLADSYTQLAKQLGTTTTTVAEGADTWLNV